MRVRIAVVAALVVCGALALVGVAAAVAQPAAPPASSAFANGVPIVHVTYYAEPAMQNVVGFTEYAYCMGYPTYSWGVQTEWYWEREVGETPC